MTKKPKEIVELGERLRDSRQSFAEKVTAALQDTEAFSTDVSHAIGEISIEEAKEAVISYFSEQIRK